MPNKTVSNGFLYQEMISALEVLDRVSPKKVSSIKVSLDFYYKIKNNILDLDFSKRENFFGLPVIIDKDLSKDYEFIYEEDEECNKMI